MPNVAGVQFPYTPQGQQAAQLYQGSLSPRQGLGFRPIGMENGGSPEDRAMLESAKRVVTELYALASDGTTQEVRAYINQSRSDLESIAQLDNSMFDMLRGLLKQFPSSVPSLPLTFPGLPFSPQADLPPTDEGPGERFARRRGRHLPSMAEPPREEEGLGSVVDSPGYYPELNGYFPPEREWGPPGGVPGMAHGGVPRGTVAGELPRYGNMSVREEGETMAELSKRHRDQDWYNRMGGGLGSLRSRMV